MSFEKERFTKEEATKHRNSAKMAKLLSEHFQDSARPLYDFGCGTGYYLAQVAGSCVFRRCTGLEGTYTIDKKDYIHIIHPVDVAQHIHLGPKGDVMSIEVGEHIAGDRLKGFIANLNHHCHERLVLTWAIRGQGGLRHVSCRDHQEVMDMILPLGFTWLEHTSMAWRDQFAGEGEEFWWFANSIYVFERK